MYLLLSFRTDRHSTEPVENAQTLGEAAASQDFCRASKAQKSLDACLNSSIDPFLMGPLQLEILYDSRILTWSVKFHWLHWLQVWVKVIIHLMLFEMPSIKSPESCRSPIVPAYICHLRLQYLKCLKWQCSALLGNSFQSKIFLFLQKPHS